MNKDVITRERAIEILWGLPGMRETPLWIEFAQLKRWRG